MLVGQIVQQVKLNLCTVMVTNNIIHFLFSQLKELVHGKGIWVCPNNLGAIIKDAESKSRTVLARSLIELFYTHEELLDVSLGGLDKDIVEACVGKWNK